MEPLSPKTRELLEHYRASISLTPEQAADNWAVIAERAHLQEEELDQRATRAPRRNPTPWVLLAAAAAALALVATLQPFYATQVSQSPGEPAQSIDRSVEPTAGGVYHDREAGSPQPTVAPRAAEDVEPAELALPVPEESSAADDDGLTGQATAQRRRYKPRVEPATPEPEPVDPLEQVRAEGQLLRQARAALTAGQARRALALTQRHEQRFADGTLAEEIAVVRLQALCELGEQPQWQAAHAAFERSYPSSPLAVHLRLDCFE